MDNIKHVALFEDRHLFPMYVKDSVFPGKTKYHVKDRDLLRQTALNSLRKWKLDGFTSIYVYLSGLNSAVRALEYAAWKLGMYLRIYEYSFSQGVWLPDTIEPFEEKSPHPFTQREKYLWKREQELRSEFKGKEETIHIFYVELFNDIKLKMRETELTWESVRETVETDYSNVCKELIDLMRPYLFTKDGKSVPKEEYNETSRRFIISWRGKKKLYIPSQKYRGYSKQLSPKDEKPGERLDRLISQAARKRPRRKR